MVKIIFFKDTSADTRHDVAIFMVPSKIPPKVIADNKNTNK
jgi:hypothetical protein